MAEKNKKRKGRWILPVIVILILAGAGVWGYFNLSFVYNTEESRSYVSDMRAQLGYRISPNAEGFAICVERYDNGVKTISEWPSVWAGPDNGSTGNLELCWNRVTNEIAEDDYLFTYLFSVANDATKQIPIKSLYAAEKKAAFSGTPIKGKSLRIICPKDGCILAVCALGENGTTAINPEELTKLEHKADSKEIKKYLAKNEITFVVKIYPYSFYKDAKLDKGIFSDKVSESFNGVDLDGKYIPVEEDVGGSADSENEGTEELSDEDMEAMMALYAMAMAEPEPIEVIDLPERSDKLSLDLAKEALTLCTGSSQQGQANIFLNSGFTVLMQEGYDKDDADESHTCAFTVAKKMVDYYGQARNLIVVAIRGTNAGEWFSNFNFAESESNESEFAESFLQASQIINLKLIPVLAENPNALVLVCGHSRGAAVANLLGMTLDDLHGSENIFVYTFATPNTYRGTEKDGKYRNIFNFLNPGDVVTEVPLKGMGYHHIGTDIVLPAEPETAERIDTAMNDLYEVSNNIWAYYNVRHSLTKAGVTADGYTAYEVMTALASSMTGVITKTNGGLDMTDLYKIMDSSETSSESDFAPLMKQLEKVVGHDGKMNVSIFGQHMPQVYGALIDAYAQIMQMMPDMSGMGEFSGMGMPEMPGGMDMSGMPEGMDFSGMSEEEIAALMSGGMGDFSGMEMPEGMDIPGMGE